MSGTGVKSVVIGCGAVIVLIIIFELLGGLVLAMNQEGLSGSVGKVWAELARGNELLTRIEDQLLYAYSDRQVLQDKISAARNDILAAQKDNATEELRMKAIESQFIALKAFTEAPVPSLTELQRGVLDETAGTYNRIKYARDNLIEAQVGFNKTRLVFFPIGLMFSHREVLGSTVNPEATLEPSRFKKQ